MKRIIQLLIVVFATYFVMSFLIARPKPAMENEGTAADWLHVDTSPVIDEAKGFEIIPGQLPPAITKPSIEANIVYGKAIRELLIGKCIKVADGDTLTILTDDNEKIRIRFEGIDCPERKQPYGNVAREYVKSTIGSMLVIQKTGQDRYGRVLGYVLRFPQSAFEESDDGRIKLFDDGLWFKGKNLNAELIRNGLAWHALEYNDSPELAELELQAREAKRELWADAEPVAPWTWRKQQREAE